MKHLLLLPALLAISTLFAQSALPIIRANTSNVAIRDGRFYYADNWTLSPETKPDVYTADRSRKPKWVVFYTDVDSIKTRVKPGSSFDFIVLLNGKDSCFTRISSAIPPETKSNPVKNSIETIPFSLTDKNAIHVQAIVNERDTLELHFDIGSFDFRFTQEAILKKTKLLANQPEALAGRSKPNFNKMEPVRKIQMGSAVWNNPIARTTLQTSHGMDGRFGWNLFEGRVVEIDYDQNLIRIQDELPKSRKGYKKSEIEFMQSFVCIHGALKVKNKAYKGLFLVDTGSDMALILDSVWMVKQGFPKDLPLVKITTFSDPRGVKYESRTVRCPAFSTNGFTLTQVPANLLGSNNPVGFEVNYLGNEVMKRYNTILDFKHDRIYLKPSKHFMEPFGEKGG